MLQVHGRKNSNQVIQVMWTIGELGLEHVRHDVGGSFGGLDTPAYGALNPNRLIPTIEEDGFVLWESYAIIRYLCRRHGRGTLWPGVDREAAVADQWMEWASSRFMPVFFPVFWGLIRTPVEKRDSAAIAAGVVASAELLGLVEARLDGREYLVGDTLTMGDIPLGSLMFKWFSLEIERPPLPNVEAWYGRLRVRSAYREHAMNPFGRNSEEWLALERGS